MKQIEEVNLGDTQSEGLRIVLCALNAKYSHTSLAIRLLREALLKQSASSLNIIVAEYTINDHPQQLLQRLHEAEGDVYAFSCYVWNSELVRRLCRDLGYIRPDATIILGGPEAAWQQRELLEELPEVDFILSGEGEINLPQLLECLSMSIETDSIADNISGIAWRSGSDGIRINRVSEHITMADWPFPYNDNELVEFKDRILYYESSRGCPYGCTYCMSSRDRLVRFRDEDTVKNELEIFMSADVKLVKFVDRTFNCNPERALKLWKYLMRRSLETGCRTRFHFEIAADLLDEESIEALSKAPEGLFQFEIGVQSCQPEILKLIKRSCNLTDLFINCRKLRKNGRIHLHLDLIAGLPSETLQQLASGFNQVLELSPHMLQLGFLKILPGSIMREQAEDVSMLWRHYPPYEVLASDAMCFDDLLLLKRIELQLDRYYNNDNFQLASAYMLEEAKSGFALFQALAELYRKLGWEDKAPGRHAIWQLPVQLLDSEYASVCFGQDLPDAYLMRDCLLLDYICSGQKDQPEWHKALELSELENDRKAVALMRERHRQEYPQIRRVRVEYFSCNPSRLLQLRQELTQKGRNGSDLSAFVHADINQSNDVRKSTGWFAVFDMSASTPSLIWQLSACDDISNGKIRKQDKM